MMSEKKKSLNVQYGRNRRGNKFDQKFPNWATKTTG